MKYDAITLDTNIFDRNRLNLRSGMLKPMEQFKGGVTQFVLSEIVIREVHRHLALQVERAREALADAVEKAEATELVDAAQLAALKGAHAAAAIPREAAKKRLQDFVDRTGCDVLVASEGEMKRLIKMYFGVEAPFDDSEKKKNEFPDAIALMTLEDWAKKNGKKLLAISNDSGWQRFAEKSEWIDAQPELAPALQQLQDDAKVARAFVQDLLQKMESGEDPDHLSWIEGRVESEVGELSPISDGSSGYYYDADLAELSFNDMTFLRSEDGFDFYIVEIGKDKVVARVGVNIKAHAQAHFVFKVRDEGDYIPMGDCLAETNVEFDAGVLLTFFGDFVKEPPEFDIEQIELVDAIKSVDFGSVEIDWDSADRYDADC